MGGLWLQPYYLFGTSLGVSALLAILPTLLLLFLLAALRKPSWVAALAGLAFVAFIAMKAERPWQRIGLRSVGSWIAASAILVLALRFAR